MSATKSDIVCLIAPYRYDLKKKLASVPVRIYQSTSKKAGLEAMLEHIALETITSIRKGLIEAYNLQ
jgi:hypothetical protein